MSKDKESECGCAGVFNSTYCLSILAQIFEEENALHNLENFVSKNGANHYQVSLNQEKTKLKKLKSPLILKKYLNLGREKIRIFDPTFPLFWKVEN